MPCSARVPGCWNAPAASAWRSTPSSATPASANPDGRYAYPKYRPTLVDPFHDHLRERRAEDPAVPVQQLLVEIKQLGYTGSQNLLYRYINQGRVECDRPAISPKRLAGLLLTEPSKLTGHHAERLDAATTATATR